MPRIAKADVAAALDRAAANIVNARGPDGVTSRADLKEALKSIASPTERALTERFYRFIDHRDARPGARITASDVDRATAYAQEHMLAKYDLAPRNGYSASEIARMSVTGQLAVKLAAEIKGLNAPPPPGSMSELGRAVTEVAKDALYMSESDSTPTFVEVSTDRPLTGELVLELFRDQLRRAYEYDELDIDDLTFEKLSPQETREFFPGMSDVSDPNDEFELGNAAAWQRLGAVLDANLTDMQIFRVGPRDEDDRTQMGVDQGAYEYFVLGKTSSGTIAGVTFESVET